MNYDVVDDDHYSNEVEGNEYRSDMKNRNDIVDAISYSYEWIKGRHNKVIIEAIVKVGEVRFDKLQEWRCIESLMCRRENCTRQKMIKENVRSVDTGNTGMKLGILKASPQKILMNNVKNTSKEALL